MAKPVFKTTSKKRLGDYSIEVPAAERIFSEGDLGTEMYIIHEGKVEILQQVAGEDKQLAVLEKGDFFGEMSLLDDLPRSASARALTEVKLLQINSSTFSHMLRDNPEIAVRMMRKLSRRLRQTDRMLREALSSGGPDSAPSVAVPAPDPVRDPDTQVGPERLVDKKSGMEFHFSRTSETTIGRRDPVTGIYPDIDLTPVDTQRSISRRHAKIYRRAERFYLAEEIGTMNGTFCNGTRLETGVPAEIRAGDEVRLGMVVTNFAIE